MRVYNQALFFIFMMLFSTLLGTAQNFSNYQYFGSESGLSDKQVKSIIQDKKGLMWIGTANGLNRFDGKNFLHINDVPYSTLKGTFIHSIIDDTEGNLVLGTNNGIEFFDPYTFKSTALNIERFTGKRPTFQIILFKSSKGYIYAMIGNYFLLRIDKHKNIIQVKCPDNQDGLFRNLNCITEDVNGHIWMSDFYGKIYTLKDGESSLRLFKDFGVQFHRINFTKKLGLLISSDYGLYRFDTTQKTINRIYPGIGPCSNILEDKTGVIWVSDEYEKLYKIGNETLTDETKILRLANEFNYRIGPIVQDNKSNFWVGTDFGMVKFIEAPKKFNLLFTANQKQIDNLNTSIRMFSEDTISKDVYFASYSGVFKIDYKTKKIDSILLESDKMIIPYSILYDDGKLWIGSEGTGFYKYDLKTKTNK
jgi:ligand-binding sensor domain-containing protein